MVIAACEQCGRNHVPPVGAILDFPAWLEHVAKLAGQLFLLDPEATSRLRDLTAPVGAATLLAGPEGGFDGNERDAAIRAGFTRLSLGPRILRTETAALAALAAMQSQWGDL